MGSRAWLRLGFSINFNFNKEKIADSIIDVESLRDNRSKGRQSQDHYSFKITIALVFHCTKHFWELYLLCTSFTISLDISIFIALRCGNQGSERLLVIYGHITIKCQTKDYQPQVSQLQIVCSFLCIRLTYPCWSLINNYQSTWNNLIFKTFPKAAM